MSLLDSFDDEVAKVRRDREAEYDDPRKDFARLAKYWTLQLQGAGLLTDDQEIPIRLVATMMVCLKINRESFFNKPDNLHDIAGYAKAGHKALYNKED